MQDFRTFSSRKEFTSRERERGQILLVVVLVMVVILTVGLSLATRNITNQRQSTDEQDSQKAFSAAEAGIQVALEKNASIPNTPINKDANYAATITQPTARQFAVNGGNKVLANEAVDIWLSNYPGNTGRWSGTMTLLWGETSDSPCQTAAIEVAVLSRTITNPVLRQYAYDPCSNTQPGNRFSIPGAASPPNNTVNNKTYKYAVNIPINAEPGILARVVPLYRPTTFAVITPNGLPPLPPQGTQVESVGSSGDTKRKIVVFQGYPKLPLELFPYTLFSPSQ